jgi:hypothetical protein
MNVCNSSLARLINLSVIVAVPSLGKSILPYSLVAYRLAGLFLQLQLNPTVVISGAAGRTPHLTQG